MKIFLAIILLLKLTNIMAETTSRPFHSFDLKVYNPQKIGLKDLTYEVRISNLKDILKSKLTIPIKNEVYFKAYWMSPGRLKVEVYGLPEGFVELKNELSKLVHMRSDLVIPQSFSNKMRSYKFSKKREAQYLVYTGIDESNQRSINKVTAKLTSDSILKSFTTFSPLGKQSAEFSFAKSSWSNNKLSLKKLETTAMAGITKTNMITEIDYIVVEGYGFPKTVKVQTIVEIVGRQGQNDKKKVNIMISFSNYKINKGEAVKALKGSNNK
jgi:hypothetical protein